VERPCVLDRADDVLAPMRDDAGDVADRGDVAEELVRRLEEAAVGEVVVLDARESEREGLLAEAHVAFRVLEELGRAPLPDGPRARGLEARRLVLRGEALVLGGDHPAALLLGDRRRLLFKLVREEEGSAAAALVEEVELLRTQHEDAAEEELRAALRVRLRLGEREGGAPAPAPDLPALDPEALAERLDVADEIPRRVRDEGGVRRRAAAAALVEEDDLLRGGVVEAAQRGRAAAPRPSVKDDDGLARRVAADLPVDRVPIVALELPRLLGLDRGLERARLGAPRRRVHRRRADGRVRARRVLHREGGRLGVRGGSREGTMR
jgi:hypothetical protein